MNRSNPVLQPQQALKQHLANNGYIILRNILAKETTDAISSFLTTELNRSVGLLTEFGLPDDLVQCGREIPALFQSKSEHLTFEQKQLLTGHFPLQTRLAEALWAIPRDVGLRGVLHQALEAPNLYMHMPPTARFVLPGNTSAGVPAHQDSAYNQHMPDFLTVWAPLVDVDKDCGGVTVFRGSHQAGDVSVEQRSGIWYGGISTDGFEPFDCVPMSAGDILIMTPRMVHASMTNQSDKPRLSVDLRFFGIGQSGKHFLDMQTWVARPPNAPAVSAI